MSSSTTTNIVKLLQPDGAGHMERIFKEYSISESGSPNGSPSAAALLPAYLTNEAFVEVVTALTSVTPGNPSLPKANENHSLFSVSYYIFICLSKDSV
jgi:hypothetical protein